MVKHTITKLIRKKGVVFQEIDGVAHILDEKHDAIVTLSETATLLWQFLAKPSSSESLAAKLVSIYSIPLKLTIKDVEDFTKEMRKLNLISEVR